MKIGTALERAQEISLLVLNVWEGHQGLIPHYQKKTLGVYQNTEKEQEIQRSQ